MIAPTRLSDDSLRHDVPPPAGDAPTPEEIYAACQAIQRTWNAAQRRKRATSQQRGWQPPVIACDREVLEYLVSVRPGPSWALR